MTDLDPAEGQQPAEEHPSRSPLQYAGPILAGLGGVITAIAAVITAIRGG